MQIADTGPEPTLEVPGTDAFRLSTRTWSVARANLSLILGAAIVALYLLLIPLAPLIAPYSPTAPSPDYRQSPSPEHLFGTDPTGMDVFSRVVYAARIDVTIALAGTLISLAIGIPLGLLVGYYSGRATSFLLRVADVLQAFPLIVLAMALVAVMGNNVTNIIYVIAFLNVPIYMRLVRSEVLGFRQRPVLEAARGVGNSDLGIVWKYVLPNCVGSALAHGSVNVGWAILIIAGLSFIGVGVPVPTPEWGSMIAIGAQTIVTGEWWSSLFPGLAISLCVIGFALLGDGLRAYLDPVRR